MTDVALLTLYEMAATGLSTITFWEHRFLHPYQWQETFTYRGGAAPVAGGGVVDPLGGEDAQEIPGIVTAKLYIYDTTPHILTPGQPQKYLLDSQYRLLTQFGGKMTQLNGREVGDYQGFDINWKCDARLIEISNRPFKAIQADLPYLDVTLKFQRFSAWEIDNT